jgi:hypothetical protein
MVLGCSRHFNSLMLLNCCWCQVALAAMAAMRPLWGPTVSTVVMSAKPCFPGPRRIGTGWRQKYSRPQYQTVSRNVQHLGSSSPAGRTVYPISSEKFVSPWRVSMQHWRHPGALDVLYIPMYISKRCISGQQPSARWPATVLCWSMTSNDMLHSASFCGTWRLQHIHRVCNSSKDAIPSPWEGVKPRSHFGQQYGRGKHIAKTVDLGSWNATQSRQVGDSKPTSIRLLLQQHLTLQGRGADCPPGPPPPLLLCCCCCCCCCCCISCMWGRGADCPPGPPPPTLLCCCTWLRQSSSTQMHLLDLRRLLNAAKCHWNITAGGEGGG